MKILTVPNDLLRQVSEEVTTLPTAEWCAEFFEMMEGAAGLAAPQVGLSQRIIAVHSLGVLVNPEFEVLVGKDRTEAEGCLSIPGRRIMVRRPDRIRVGWTMPSGLSATLKLRGFVARCFQHEVDHLDGILMTDREVR